MEIEIGQVRLLSFGIEEYKVVVAGIEELQPGEAWVTICRLDGTKLWYTYKHLLACSVVIDS